MTQKILYVSPEAPVADAAPDVARREFSAGGLRIGILDNSKGNADHLLRMVVDGISKEIKLSSLVSLRKPFVSMAAPAAILDQLAREADVVISAMAD